MENRQSFEMENTDTTYPKKDSDRRLENVFAEKCSVDQKEHYVNSKMNTELSDSEQEWLHSYFNVETMSLENTPSVSTAIATKNMEDQHSSKYEKEHDDIVHGETKSKSSNVLSSTTRQLTGDFEKSLHLQKQFAGVSKRLEYTGIYPEISKRLKHVLVEQKRLMIMLSNLGSRSGIIGGQRKNIGKNNKVSEGDTEFGRLRKTKSVHWSDELLGGSIVQGMDDAALNEPPVSTMDCEEHSNKNNSSNIQSYHMDYDVEPNKTFKTNNHARYENRICNQPIYKNRDHNTIHENRDHRQLTFENRDLNKQKKLENRNYSQAAPYGNGDYKPPTYERRDLKPTMYGSEQQRPGTYENGDDDQPRYGKEDKKQPTCGNRDQSEATNHGNRDYNSRGRAPPPEYPRHIFVIGDTLDNQSRWESRVERGDNFPLHDVQKMLNEASALRNKASYMLQKARYLEQISGIKAFQNT